MSKHTERRSSAHDASGRPFAGSASFTHIVRVRWSDCDPARIAFTARLPAFALESIDAFWEHVTGDDWFRMNIDKNTGTPFVHISMDFKLPVTPRHPLVCEVRIADIGRSSVRFAVTGRQDDKVCFVGEFVEVFTDASEHRKIDIPEAIRADLERHAAGNR